MPLIDPVRATSGANEAATATVDAVSGAQIQGVMVHFSYSATPTGGGLTIKRGSTVIDEVDIIAGGPGFLPLDGFRSGVNESFSATLAAGGSGVVGKVNLSAEYA